MKDIFLKVWAKNVDAHCTRVMCEQTGCTRQREHRQPWGWQARAVRDATGPEGQLRLAPEPRWVAALATAVGGQLAHLSRRPILVTST